MLPDGISALQLEAALACGLFDDFDGDGELAAGPVARQSPL
jgi:hypothetical protein